MKKRLKRFCTRDPVPLPMLETGASIDASTGTLYKERTTFTRKFTNPVKDKPFDISVSSMGISSDTTETSDPAIIDAGREDAIVDCDEAGGLASARGHEKEKTDRYQVRT